MTHKQPWPHTITDNFFDQDDHKSMVVEIVNHLRKSVRSKRLLFRHSDPQFKIDLPNTFEILDKIVLDPSPFPQVREGGYRYEHEVSILIDKTSYPIHDEAEHKVLSNVVYLFPAIGTGTILYDEDKNFHSEVKWEQNRALLFAGITGKTWHSYETKENTVRITINSFLCRDV